MAEPRTMNEETARLKWFEAFMHRRVELEQQTISGLQVLLEGAPPLPERKLLWHCALEKLLDGTREELHIRVEELKMLKDQMPAMTASIAKAEMWFRDIKFRFEKLEPTDEIDSAQAATETSHKEWNDIKSVGVQKRLSGFLFSGQAQKEKLKLKAREAFQEHYEQDLTYRRIVHWQQQSQRRFLTSIPHRLKEYGPTYWVVVRDLGMVMESFANYLRNISSTCNSYGSALWASAKNIKPVVDANCHTEAIEFEYHQSPICFSPIYYQNPGSNSPSSDGQTILFGCPLELCTVGELKKIPPVLEYLLDSARHSWPRQYFSTHKDECWHLVNALEQAWTGVEKTDRALISKLVLEHHRSSIIIAYFNSLPRPVISNDDIQNAQGQSASQVWNMWSKDPIKLAVLRAILSCEISVRLTDFRWDMGMALSQKPHTSTPIDNLLLFLERYPQMWESPINNVQANQ